MRIINTLNKTVIALLGVILISSCRKELLDTLPTDRISTEIYWKTDADATNASTAIYTFMDGANPASVPVLFWDGFTDIGHFNRPGFTEYSIEQGIADAQNSRFAEQYVTCYKGIHAVNFFLENVGRITVSNATLVDTRIAEVKTLRAYFYLKLVSWYGAVPLVTETINIEEGAQLTRTDVNTIYDFISTELDAAAALLPNTQSDQGRITKGAALAIKARAMLYAGRYESAAEAAKSVIDLGVYSLYPKFQTLFSYAAENNSEVILDKQFLKDLYSNNAFAVLAPASQASAQATVVPTKELADEYEMNDGKSIDDPASDFDPANPYINRDPRFRFTMFVPGDVLPNNKIYNSVPGSGTADAVGGGNLYASTTGYNVKKYVNIEDMGTPNNGGINIILIRYPEVLLTYAEAKIELDQIDQSVFDAVNEIRGRSDVNMPELDPDLSRDQLRTAVRHERIVELAFEGLHLFDVRRWKTAEGVIPGPVRGITYLKNGEFITVTNTSSVRTFNPAKDYLWPIPQQEITINKNLTQNPGW